MITRPSVRPTERATCWPRTDPQSTVFPVQLATAELHDAHGVGRLAVVRQNAPGDPKITAANNSPHREPLFARLTGARDLYVASTADSLAVRCGRMLCRSAPSRLTFPLSHTKQDCNPPEKEPKALKRMSRRIHERSGGEPHCHPDCDSRPASPVQRRPIAKANFRSEPVPRPNVHGAPCCELTCFSSAGSCGIT